MPMGARQAHEVLPRTSRVIARERRDRSNLEKGHIASPAARNDSV